MKKIKVFLGAYINQSNAQNLNCNALAENLNKGVFEVFTLKIEHGNLGDISIPGVRTFSCIYPVKITQIFGFIWGFLKADVVYLPRLNSHRLQLICLNIFGRKSFKTVENVIDEESLESALGVLRTPEKALRHYRMTDRVYSITDYLKHYNFEKHGLKTAYQILPPVVDTRLFSQPQSPSECLERLVFISNDMRRKRVQDFLLLAKAFPMLKFEIIGRDADNFLSDLLRDYKFENISYHGLLNQQDLKTILTKCQVHILPSRSEGFPKGIIECAAAGIPSITYADYGASEWINSFENGVVCETYEEIEGAILSFVSSPELLRRNSNGALELAAKFSVENVVRLYEGVFLELANERV